MEIALKCTGPTFSLTGDDGSECFEGVDSFKYLVRFLHRPDEEWPVVCRNIRKARQVWICLGKLLSKDGAEPIVSERFYREVV